MKKRCVAFLLTALLLCQPLLGLAEETAAALQTEDRVGERGGASFSLPQFSEEPEISTLPSFSDREELRKAILYAEILQRKI